LVQRGYQWLNFFSYFKKEGAVDCLETNSLGHCTYAYDTNSAMAADQDQLIFDVVQTDFTSVAGIYTCKPVWLGMAIQEDYRILSRTSTLDAATLQLAKDNMSAELVERIFMTV
jgi:hypothetical protein